MRAWCAGLAVGLSLSAVAQAETPIPLPPGAVQTASEVADPATYALPVGRFTVDQTPVVARAGEVTLRAWRWPGEGATPVSVKLSLQAAFEAEGYRTRFSCTSEGCGGFDFRYQTRVLPPPGMEIDLTAFWYLALERRGEDGWQSLSLLLSRSPRGNYLQAIEVAPSDAAAPALAIPASPGVEVAGAAGLFAEIEAAGRAVLSGMDFAPGVTALTPEVRESLAEVARYLVTYPEAAIVIVGHTDNVGSLESNIRVGRERAAAVRAALIADYAIAPERLEVAGAGYLAPLARNDTEEGRAENRRVEVILR